MSEGATTSELERLSRGSAEAADRGDFDAAVAIFQPDAVWDWSALGIGAFEGREAIRRGYEDWRAAYEDFESEFEEFVDLGGTVSFFVLTNRGRLTGSSHVVELRYASVATWADGLVGQVTTFSDIDEARAVAERLAEERA